MFNLTRKSKRKRGAFPSLSNEAVYVKIVGNKYIFEYNNMVKILPHPWVLTQEEKSGEIVGGTYQDKMCGDVWNHNTWRHIINIFWLDEYK